MVYVTLLIENSEIQEAVVDFAGKLFVTELIFLEYVEADIYLVNSEYLAEIDTCTWCD